MTTWEGAGASQDCRVVRWETSSIGWLAKRARYIVPLRRCECGRAAISSSVSCASSRGPGDTDEGLAEETGLPYQMLIGPTSGRRRVTSIQNPSEWVRSISERRPWS
jgi:hypothetical protein